ncbi:MAG: hypothetical protein KC609_02900 [Myxococcales bacterium]|nr:hypothetical protein [Myxococcales bacterium]
MDSTKAPSTIARVALRLVHWAIIINFAIEIVYAAYMIFVVFAHQGGGPLWTRALTIPHEKMVTRRLYAIEFWLAFVGLAIYLALTEIGPRLARQRRQDESIGQDRSQNQP